MTIVTIITPMYNATSYIPEYIHSIKSQTFSSWKCIIVDDSSTDQSLQLAFDLTYADQRFQVLSNPHSNDRRAGPSSARNLAISLVQTQLIAFCDIDDLWHPQKLELQVHYHLQNGLDLSVSAYASFNSSPLQPLLSIIKPISSLTLARLLTRNTIPMLTVILSSKLALNNFTPIKHEDYLYWLKIFKGNNDLKYGFLPLLLAFYRVHPHSISSNKLAMPIWTYSVYKQFGLSTPESLLTLLKWSISHASLIFSRFVSQSSFYSVNDLMEMPPLHVEQGE